jgi:hypothetical protein
MRSIDSPELFDRVYRQPLRAIAGALEQAYTMLPPDSAARTAIDRYNDFVARLDVYDPREADLGIAALDALETCAERAGMRGKFWRIMMDVATMSALYERAAGYRDRAATA